MSGFGVYRELGWFDSAGYSRKTPEIDLGLEVKKTQAEVYSCARQPKFEI
jgi:hypothetical protein